MKSLGRRIAFSFLILSAAAGPARADLVVTRNGQVLEGVIEQETESRVMLRMPGGQLTLLRSQITEIQRSTPTENAALQVRGHLRNGNVLKCLQELADLAEKAETQPEAEAILPGLLLELGEELAAQTTPLRDGDRRQARHRLEALRPALTGSPQALMTLARLARAAGDERQASDALVSAGLDWISAREDLRNWSMDFLRAYVRDLAEQSRYPEAVEQIERLRLLDPSAAENQEPLLALTRSARARDTHDYELALRIIREDIFPELPEVARNRAAVTLRALVTWAERNQRERDARRWIKSYALAMIPVEGLAYAHQLYLTEAKRFVREGRPAMALRLLDQVPPDERGEALARVAAEAQYEVLILDAGTDPTATFEVGIWAAENELYDEAIYLLEDLRNYEPLKELADQQLALMKEERDIFLLKDALEAYDRGLMREAIILAERIQSEKGRESPLVADARDLEALARSELRYAEQAKPYEAEILYQQAERAFFRDSIDESFNLIDVILSNFADTPAAQRAATLLPDVMRQFELQLVEGRRKLVPSYQQTVSHGELMRSEQLDTEIRSLLQSLSLAEGGEVAQQPAPTPGPSPDPEATTQEETQF